MQLMTELILAAIENDDELEGRYYGNGLKAINTNVVSKSELIFVSFKGEMGSFQESSIAVYDSEVITSFVGDYKYELENPDCDIEEIIADILSDIKFELKNKYYNKKKD